MKKSGFIAPIICAGLVLASCGQSANGAPSATPSSSEVRERYLAELTMDSAPIADLTDLEVVSRVYVKPLVATGGIFSYSWASASDIKPDDLLNILCYNNFLNLPQDGEGVYRPSNDTPSADKVETALQKHFDVMGDYLKTSTRYNAATQTYQMVGGFGGGGGAVAMSAKLDGNQITIRVALMQNKSDMTEVTKSAVPDGKLDMTDEMVLTPKGTLKLELADGNVVKYSSYQLDDGVTW